MQAENEPIVITIHMVSKRWPSLFKGLNVQFSDHTRMYKARWQKHFFFLDFIYLFMKDTEREREAEGEAGSMQGA